MADDDNDQFLLLWEDVGEFTAILPESWYSSQEVEPLLEFEELETPLEADFSEHKTRGDQLLSLGDAAAAMRYYEHALQSIPLQIGCTITLLEESCRKKSSVLRRAEVDCIEADGVDVTILPGGSEKTIAADQVVLVLLEPDQEFLQARTLLNCARCCLQLAELSTEIKSHFAQRGVHFCSLCIVILECAEDDNNASAYFYLQTAFLLRSQALAEKHQYDAALMDLSKLLQLNPDHDVGQRRINLYKRKKEEMKQNEKKLVKAMCGYIQQATSAVSTPDDRVDTEISLEGLSTRVEHSRQISLWIVFLITAVSAWMLQKNL